MTHNNYAQSTVGNKPFLCRLWHSWRMNKYHTKAEYFICKRCGSRRIEFGNNYSLDKMDIEWLSEAKER
jgi:hypothetical protein